MRVVERRLFGRSYFLLCLTNLMKRLSDMISLIFGFNRRSHRHFSSQTEEAVNILFFETEQAVNILFFGESKPSTFYFSKQSKPSIFYFLERASRQRFIFFEAEQAVNILFFETEQAVNISFFGRKNQSTSCFSTISHYWIEELNDGLVSPVFLPCIMWLITKYFQDNLVVHFNVATIVGRDYT